MSAGPGSIAYKHEPAGNYMGSPSDSTYKIPGKDPTAEEISIDNALMRMGIPTDPETVDAIAGTFEGAISLSWTETTPWYLNHVFGGAPSKSGSGPYTYTWTFPSGADSDWRVQSSRWFIGLNYDGSNSCERELKGVVFTDYQQELSIGSEVRTTVTGFYGDEEKNTSLSPGSIDGTDAEPMVFHGGQLEIPDSTGLTRIQSATVQTTTGARPQRDMSRKPVDAVLGNVETTLTVRKHMTDTDMLELAYGGSSSPATTVSGEADGKLVFGTSGTPQLDREFTDVTPNTYGWQDVLNRDADMNEDIEFVINSEQAVATSDASSAK